MIVDGSWATLTRRWFRLFPRLRRSKKWRGCLTIIKYELWSDLNHGIGQNSTVHEQDVAWWLDCKIESEGGEREGRRNIEISPAWGDRTDLGLTEFCIVSKSLKSRSPAVVCATMGVLFSSIRPAVSSRKWKKSCMSSVVQMGCTLSTLKMVGNQQALEALKKSINFLTRGMQGLPLTVLRPSGLQNRMATRIWKCGSALCRMIVSM